MKKNKQGFFSIAMIYSFLLLFILLLFSITASYLARDNLINNIVESAKTELNSGE